MKLVTRRYISLNNGVVRDVRAVLNWLEMYRSDHNLRKLFLHEIPHVVGAQLYRLSTVDAHTDVLKPIYGKII